MLVPLIVACGLFMEQLDGTIIATALPQIAHSLDVNPLRLSVTLTSYMLSLAIFIPISGWLADKYGARTVFSIAIGVFLVGSVLCAASTSLTFMTAARVVQGMGGAMMVPVGRLVLLRSIPKSELVRAMSYLTVPALLGPVLGPPIGGFIVTYSSWRWIFLLNVPIGLIGLYFVMKHIENHKEPDTPRLDVWSFIVSTVALAGLILGFEMIGRDVDELPQGLILLGIGIVASLYYVFSIAKHPHPVLDLMLFRTPSFAISVAAGTVFRIAVGALPFLLPLQLQLGFGMTALSSGLLTFASSAGAMLMKMTARPIIHHFGFRPILVYNAVICAGFYFAYATFQPGMSHLFIFAVLLVGGFFRSLEFTAFNTLQFADVAQSHMSRATSLSSTAQQLSLSMGVTAGALLLHATIVARGGTGSLTANDFWPAMSVLGAVMLVTAMICAKLAPNAGDEVSGKLAAPVATPVPARPSAGGDE